MHSYARRSGCNACTYGPNKKTCTLGACALEDGEYPRALAKEPSRTHAFIQSSALEYIQRNVEQILDTLRAHSCNKTHARIPAYAYMNLNT